jgi:hypothetical protein
MTLVKRLINAKARRYRVLSFLTALFWVYTIGFISICSYSIVKDHITLRSGESFTKGFDYALSLRDNNEDTK